MKNALVPSAITPLALQPFNSNIIHGAAAISQPGTSFLFPEDALGMSQPAWPDF
jgi:hypothetical protein